MRLFKHTDYAASNGKVVMNDELERMWKEAVVNILRFYLCNDLEGMSKTTKTLRIANYWIKVQAWDLPNMKFI
jgi:hypothetical protein